MWYLPGCALFACSCSSRPCAHCCISSGQRNGKYYRSFSSDSAVERKMEVGREGGKIIMRMEEVREKTESCLKLPNSYSYIMHVVYQLIFERVLGIFFRMWIFWTGMVPPLSCGLHTAVLGTVLLNWWFYQSQTLFSKSTNFLMSCVYWHKFECVTIPKHYWQHTEKRSLPVIVPEGKIY